MTSKIIDECTDGELINLYVEHRKQSDVAMRTLVGRYHDQMYGRFFAKVNNRDDANDLQQELWSKVARSLDRYRDEEKFSHYLSRLASNVLIDFYRRGTKNKELFADGSSNNANFDSEDDGFEPDTRRDESQNVEQEVDNDDLVRHLISELVPALPVEQRAAWLLRHESEYWEPGRRLDWNHLAELNNLTETAVVEIFESARNKMMTQLHAVGGQGTQVLEEMELLVFLVWTQAQRLDKANSFTWDYFAELLGQPVNTMKTRYRTAQKTLSDGLNAYIEG